MPADNEAARAAFANIVAEAEAEQERVARILADSGPGDQFTAVAPLSGAVFTWDGQGRRTDDAE